MDADVPTAGFYEMAMRRGEAPVAIRIWFAAPADPLTGELLDRAPRWQAEVEGRSIAVDQVWPRCGKHPIRRADYLRRAQQGGR